uniref:B30.2/SPRY domain-containing protein n=1 Tax=Piliocolobus tephrosceles TaxID=591936 RepID=A0A8C9HHM8_9PRIM
MTSKNYIIHKSPGYDYNSFGYKNDDGKKIIDGKIENYSNGFTQNDIIGCGINYFDNSAFFTKNGKYLGKVCTINSKYDYYATVALSTLGDCVKFHLNNFYFDIYKLIYEENEKERKIIKSIYIQKDIFYNVIKSHLIKCGYLHTYKSFISFIEKQTDDNKSNSNVSNGKTDNDVFFMKKIDWMDVLKKNAVSSKEVNNNTENQHKKDEGGECKREGTVEFQSESAETLHMDVDVNEQGSKDNEEGNNKGNGKDSGKGNDEDSGKGNDKDSDNGKNKIPITMEQTNLNKNNSNNDKTDEVKNNDSISKVDISKLKCEQIDVTIKKVSDINVDTVENENINSKSVETQSNKNFVNDTLLVNNVSVPSSYDASSSLDKENINEEIKSECTTVNATKITLDIKSPTPCNTPSIILDNISEGGNKTNDKEISNLKDSSPNKEKTCSNKAIDDRDKEKEITDTVKSTCEDNNDNGKGGIDIKSVDNEKCTSNDKGTGNEKDSNKTNL